MDHHNHKPETFGGIILKVLLIVIVGGSIFGVGVCAGIRAAAWRGVGHFNKTIPPQGMMHSKTDGGSVGMVERWGKDNDDRRVSRIFGTITKIEANQITILDNAAKNEIVLSLATTVITSSSTEIGLGALKVDQNIVAIGALNANNLFEAKVIQVQ